MAKTCTCSYPIPPEFTIMVLVANTYVRNHEAIRQLIGEGNFRCGEQTEEIIQDQYLIDIYTTPEIASRLGLPTKRRRR